MTVGTAASISGAPLTDDAATWTRRALWSAGAVFALWAVLPPLVMPNITLDAAEGLVWAAGFELGYEKHPPLQAWLLKASLLIGRGSWAHVWMSAACAALMHLFVWRGARVVVGPAAAFWASAALQTVFYVNYAIPEFNPNVLLLPVFAAAGWFALLALEKGRARDWIGLGLILGLGMYAKYTSAVIAIVIAAFFLLDPAGRKRLAAPWPYLGALAAGLVFLPHAMWVLAMRGETVDYVLDRAQIAEGFLGRLGNVGEFVLSAIGTSLFLLLAMLLGRSWRARGVEGQSTETSTFSPATRMVYALALGPFVVTLIAAVVFGFRIKSAWTAPFWTWAPLALLLALDIDVRARAWRRGAATIAGFAAFALIAFLGVNSLGPRLSGEALRIHFPGAPLAAELERIWAEQGGEGPLPAIIGETFVAESAAHFAPSAPVVRDHPNEALNPWASDAFLAENGGLIVWDAYIDEGGGAELVARYPRAAFVEVLELAPLTAGEAAPSRIGVAYLPPEP
ncbi:MAG: glycosyltransferase family 39 protein [Maricaulaceae bacterium]|jgi:hypothetical protein